MQASAQWEVGLSGQAETTHEVRLAWYGGRGRAREGRKKGRKRGRGGRVNSLQSTTFLGVTARTSFCLFLFQRACSERRHGSDKLKLTTHHPWREFERTGLQVNVCVLLTAFFLGGVPFVCLCLVVFVAERAAR